MTRSSFFWFALRVGIWCVALGAAAAIAAGRIAPTDGAWILVGAAFGVDPRAGALRPGAPCAE